MLETGTVSSVQHATSESSRALAIAAKSSGPGHGLAVFDKKGELSRADGVTVFPGGIVDMQGLGPHRQHGDVDFQVLDPPGALYVSFCAYSTRVLRLALGRKW